MERNTKFLLGTVSLICLLSLVFNGVLLKRNNSSASGNGKACRAPVTPDSLERLISERDTLSAQIDSLKNEKKALESQQKRLREWESSQDIENNKDGVKGK